MTISDTLLPQFDYEMAQTRKTLERIPEDKFAWQPHEKSPSLEWLASHLANLPIWAAITIAQDDFDLGAMPPPPTAFETRQAVLDTFDSNVAAAHAAIAGASDEALLHAWTLRRGEQVFFSMPRIAVLRGFVLSHMIHHRAQLGVYLRLNDIPVPSLYGPSADEPM
jgi:uncharacterized damage-inducible protein DinB